MYIALNSKKQKIHILDTLEDDEYYCPVCDEEVIKRNKTIKLIFLTVVEDPDICYLELVTWAIENELTSDYKRFFTSYRISNFDELYEALVKKEL